MIADNTIEIFTRSARNLTKVTEVRDSISGIQELHIHIPCIYPSGSTALARVVTDGQKWHIDDMANGHNEADLSGRGGKYAEVAKKLAVEWGFDFESLSFRFTTENQGIVVGSAVMIINASVLAANLALSK